MTLKELYEQIENPLNKKKVEKLIEVYSNSSSKSFYNALIQTTKKEGNGRYYTKDGDIFYSMLFNKWKNSIVNLTKEEYLELYKKGSFDKDLIILQDYLKTVPDVQTWKEANKILYGTTGNQELDDAIEKYKWSAFGEYSGWTHVCSRYLTAKKDPYQQVHHRLYINSESLDTYKLTTLFIKKCDERHLPYYFKYDEYGDRDDTLVVYSSNENLMEYVEILKEIKKENPELISRMKTPPILTGKIDEWIGYGSEPELKPNGQKTSFNSLRTELIEPIIDDKIKSWIQTHLDSKVTIEGKDITMEEYLVTKATEKYILDLKKKYKIWMDFDQERARRRNEQFDPSATILDLGFSIEEIDNEKFEKEIYSLLKDKIKNMTQEFLSGKAVSEIEIIKYELNGKEYNFSGYDIRDFLKWIALDLSKIDPNIVSEIETEIKSQLDKFGIDEKLCFDKHIVEKIKSDSKSQDKKPKEKPKHMKETKPENTAKEEPKKEENTPIYEGTNEEIDMPHSNEFIPGTDIYKPRYREVYETEKEYTEYLREYYEKYFKENNKQETEENITVQSTIDSDKKIIIFEKDSKVHIIGTDLIEEDLSTLNSNIINNNSNVEVNILNEGINIVDDIAINVSNDGTMSLNGEVDNIEFYNQEALILNPNNPFQKSEVKPIYNNKIDNLNNQEYEQTKEKIIKAKHFKEEDKESLLTELEEEYKPRRR